ncbi:MAG TPA: alpha-ketoglutarate dehydrogenase [Burkholderiales bacterium]|nr:alpha-ketoglutarate dehydrogenase [Burkholderiales bacterium]
MSDLSDIQDLKSAFWRVLPPDLDPVETREWLEAFDAVVKAEGRERATFLLMKLLEQARQLRVPMPPVLNTPYANTISVADQPPFPGNAEIEARLSALVRWNALAMVVRANRDHPELGGHIATYASSADLFEVGYNHFFRAGQNGDAVYFQPHSAPGVYARAYLEGRLSEEHLANYRRETGGGGLSSYCHPWLMPTFWQFPTGSMGLGPITAIYQARFMRYLEHRAIAQTAARKVWCFVGDGEMDEPESLAGLSMAAREGLDNLIFVVNCNLQRLDGPVRGNGSIIQELEGLFAGAGWNVIKVMWGSDWDSLFARDTEHVIIKRLHETVDGEFQKYAATDGRFNREHFFNKYPELQKLVAHLSDEDIDRLHRGGHDPVKIHAAYHAAVNHKGRPTVILAQTKKGYGMGHWGQGKMTAHQAKKLEDDALLAFRDRFALPLSDADVHDLRFYKPADDSPEMKYLHARRQALGGYLPARVPKAQPLAVPELSAFAKLLEGTGEREQSTTMVFVQMLAQMLRDKQLGRHIVPIVADEARTFGMQSLFRQVAIYSPFGQLYEPEDKDELLYYKEAKEGQILEEGITEAGAISSWIAAATSYSAHGVPMLPFYIFYSCFGFQRIGDLVWAAADSRSRGFLLGATAGRTTLSGEGLQHEDGSSHLLFSTVPNCVAYDPAYGYELTVILRDGMRRLLENQEDVFYYVTVMNENYVHPAMPQGAEEGILKGMYRIREAQDERREAKQTVQLLGAGTILREVLAAAEMLEHDWGVSADVWSVTSFTELRRDGMGAERWNRLHPGAEPKLSWVERCLADTSGPVVAASDYMRTVADLIRTWVPRRYVTLGTDGFGRSDTRERLRDYFEVDRRHVAVVALKALADEGTIDRGMVVQAIEKYGIAAERRNPWDC